MAIAIERAREETSTPRVPASYPSPHSYTHEPPILHRYPTRSRTKQANTARVENIQQHRQTNDLKDKFKNFRTIKLQNEVKEGVQTKQTQKESAFAVFDEASGKLLQYKQLLKTKDKDIWKASLSNEFGRLAQGNARVKGTDTIKFIHHHQMPKDRKTTYASIVVSIRPEKTETHRTRLTVGGNLIDYPGDVSTDTADLTTAKLLFNSIISTKKARFLGIDISNFYLNTPMKRYEYLKIPIEVIPEDIIEQYNLHTKEYKGFIYIEVRKGMYGLPQAGKLANDLLKENLKPHGYEPVKHTPGLWRHTTRPTMFSLVVDDFGTKILNDEDEAHIIETLQKYYKITVNKKGVFYLGMHLDWDYKNGTVDISMPGRVQAGLKRFNHTKPKQPIHAPSKYTPPQYGVKKQTNTVDLSPPMTKEQAKTLQEVE